MCYAVMHCAVPVVLRLLYELAMPARCAVPAVLCD